MIPYEERAAEAKKIFDAPMRSLEHPEGQVYRIGERVRVKKESHWNVLGFREVTIQYSFYQKYGQDKKLCNSYSCKKDNGNTGSWFELEDLEKIE